MEEIKQLSSILISRKKLEWIMNNYELSTHAKDRIKERKETSQTIGELIYNSPLSWICGNQKVCIAFNLYEYIVVATDTDKPLVLTFVNMSDSKENVVDMAFNSYIKFLRGTILDKKEI